MIHKHDREDKRISKEDIKAIMKWITDRDLDILMLLLKHPFLTTTQIEMMVFNNLKPSSWGNKANERIRRLYHAHCIDRWFPPVSDGAGSSQQHIVLDRAGAEVLALAKGYEGAGKFKKRVYVPQTYQHTLKIFDFKAMLSVLSRQVGVIDGNPIGEVIRWKTEHETKMAYRNERGQKGEVIPDGFCVYKYTPTHIKAFFLEADNATMDLDQLKSKIRRYVECHRSGEWRTTEWARLLRGFPPVIILMHTQEDIRKLLTHIRSVETNIRFLLATYDDLTERSFITYQNNLGKSREVLSDIRIRLLEPIFLSNTEEGRASL